MAREKVERHVAGRPVFYDEEHWEILEGLRRRAASVQEALPVDSLVYGSVARGDVSRASDVDIHLLDQAPSYSVELALREASGIAERRITVASPNSVPKANIALVDDVTVSWPLLPERERERGLYEFGGALDARLVAPRARVPGVSKRLVLVEPTPQGHLETSVVGMEVEAARVLGVGLDVVEERVRVLTRRDAVGRTGIFRSVLVGEGETFEQCLGSMADSTPAIRRQRRYRARR